MLAIDDSIVYSKSMSTILLFFSPNYCAHIDCHDTQWIISFVERSVREYGFVISYFVLFAIYVRSESVYVQSVLYIYSLHLYMIIIIQTKYVV